LSPLGSQTSFGTLNQTRIENVADWEAIAKKYRVLIAQEPEDSASTRDTDDDRSTATGEPQNQAALAGDPTVAV
jgi:hypothetical protein